VLSITLEAMNRTHIWHNHVTIPRLDGLVLIRPTDETLSQTLAKLARWGIPTGADDIEVHGDARAP
jgi:hypothetical protein